jgi:hypothetical protein
LTCTFVCEVEARLHVSNLNLASTRWATPAAVGLANALKPRLFQSFLAVNAGTRQQEKSQNASKLFDRALLSSFFNPDCGWGTSREVRAAITLKMVGTLPAVNATYQEYDSSHLCAAGVKGGAAESASSCLKWDHQQRPETPDALKKYRQTRLHEPGKIYRHFGAYDDPVDDDKVYGRVSSEPSAGTPSSADSDNHWYTCCSLRTKMKRLRKYSRRTQKVI